MDLTISGKQIALPLEIPIVSSTSSSSTSGFWPLDRGLPVQDIEPLIRREAYNKHLYRPNTYLHKWWARRSGVLFRLILKGLVRDPARQDFYAPGGLEGLIILDPMMGGGTTLHEAIRMGANVIGIDIDPIPVLQVRASLQHLPLSEKRRVFRDFWTALREQIRPLFLTRCPVCGQEAEIQFVLYARIRRCGCGEVGVVESFTLLEARGTESESRICPVCGEVFQGAHFHHGPHHVRLVLKTKKHCPVCGKKYQDLRERPYWQRYHPIAIRGRCIHGHEFFKRPDEEDLERMAHAEAVAARLDFGPPEHWNIPHGPKTQDLHRHGIHQYLELFTPRQRIYLDASRKGLQETPIEHRLWLGLLISTSLEFNAFLAGYKGRGKNRPGAVRHVFAHHAYSLPYTALENNPVFPFPRSGTLLRLFQDRIVRASRWAERPVERRILAAEIRTVPITGELDGGQEVDSWEALRKGTRRFRLFQADAARFPLPKGLVDVVVTDPPYYDNVQYADLSHFFRVWLRYLLPKTARWEYDPLASAVSEKDDTAAQKYAQILGRIWRNVVRALKPPHGRLIFTFHHWKARAWAALTLSLRQAGLRLITYEVVFSENPISVHIQGLQALKHDAVFVLAPRHFQAPFRQWPLPAPIDSADSRTFVARCAHMLGYLLENNNIPEHHIWRIWQHFLEAT